MLHHLNKIKNLLQENTSKFHQISQTFYQYVKNFKFSEFRKSNIFNLNKKEYYLSKKLFWKRILNMTLKSLYRNKLISFITIFVLSLIVLMFNITFAVNYITNQGIKNIGEKIDIVVWLNEDASSFEIESLRNDLGNSPLVKSVIYTSKEEALVEFQKENPEVSAFLNQYALDNPLPSSLGLIAHNIEDNFKIMEFLKQDKYQNILDQEKIKNNFEEKKRTEKFLNITRFLYTSGQYLVGLFILVLIFITMNTINMLINRRSKEVLIMRLVGAKYAFIRLPFILEGILYVIGSFLVSLILMYYFAFTFKNKLSTTLTDDALLNGFRNIIDLFLHNFRNILVSEILIAIAIGIISSYLAIEWYLRKQNLLSE